MGARNLGQCLHAPGELAADNALVHEPVPLAQLSPRSQLELLEIIGENSRAGHAQFIIATHSPILLACNGAKIYSFDHVPVREISYEETDHYKIYKSFLTNRIDSKMQ